MQTINTLVQVGHEIIFDENSSLPTDQGMDFNLLDSPIEHLFDPALKVSLKAGEHLFHMGQPYTGCYRLERGLVKSVLSSPDGDDLITGIFGPSALLGVLSILDHEPHFSSIVALTDCCLSYVSHHKLSEYLKRNPAALAYFMNFLIIYVRHCHEVRSAETFMTAKQRIGYALLEFSKHTGQKNADGSTFMREKISQSDLAAMAGVARENVSRAMNEWRRRELVTISHRYYCIRDMNGLLREVFGKKN